MPWKIKMRFFCHGLNCLLASTCHTDKRKAKSEERELVVMALLAARERGREERALSRYKHKGKSDVFYFINFVSCC
jgi:hypothetical protein